jgi:hypothetical protein
VLVVPENSRLTSQVEQIRDLVKDLLLHRILDLVQPVHRPVARVICDRAPAVAQRQPGEFARAIRVPDGEVEGLSPK